MAAGGDHGDTGYDPAAVAAVFGRTAPTYDTVIPFFARFGVRLVDVADLRPGERVLDVASGRGATLFPAAARVGPDGTVLGVDLAEAMLSALAADAARRAPNASVSPMDAEALDVAEGSFDVVLAGFVLHLLPDPPRAAGGFLRALRPGGRCAAAVPAGSGPEWEFLMPLLSSFATRATRPNAVPFRPEFDAAAVLGAAGFDVVHTAIEEIEFCFADEHAWWTWAWSNGIRAVFETLAPDDLEELRREAFARMAQHRTPDGLPMRQRATMVVARKPGGG